MGDSVLDAEEQNLPEDLGIFLTVRMGGLLAAHPDGNRINLLTYITHQGLDLLEVGYFKRRCVAGVTAMPSIIAV